MVPMYFGNVGDIQKLDNLFIGIKWFIYYFYGLRTSHKPKPSGRNWNLEFRPVINLPRKRFRPSDQGSEALQPPVKYHRLKSNQKFWKQLPQNSESTQKQKPNFKELQTAAQ